LALAFYLYWVLLKLLLDERLDILEDLAVLVLENQARISLWRLLLVIVFAENLVQFGDLLFDGPHSGIGVLAKLLELDRRFRLRRVKNGLLFMQLEFLRLFDGHFQTLDLFAIPFREY